AYVAADGHQVNIRDPHVYRTRDYGQNWEKITDGIPASALSFTKVIAEDPVRRGLLYLGTENAIYASFDDGDHWQPLQNDLPHAPVSGIVIQEHFNDLVISTYGRGFWILDDLAPLQQLTPEVMASDAHLFEPRGAYRFRTITPLSTTYDDPTTGEDPEYGASINYWLEAPAVTAPMVTILDESGKVVRTLRGTNKAGINRVHWDLQDESSTAARLLTSPMYADHIMVGPEGRSAPGASSISLLMPPGRYTVKLTAGNVDQTQPLTVLRDPNSGGSEVEIAEQLALLSAIKADLELAASAVRRMEGVRLQLATVRKVVTDTEAIEAMDALARKLVDLEMNLVDLRLTNQGQDGVRFDSKLMGKLGYLAGGLAGADFRPTDQQVEVQGILAGQLREHLDALDDLMSDELGALNVLLREKGVPNIGGGG
ncbi:MAG: hypothetical protein MUO50_07715, partial [Longimicrobiales bacterium]|nr:hypothetical protein [Longimicrobiales bacterium]